MPVGPWLHAWTALLFPFPDQVHDALSVSLSDHLQLEYTSRDGIADPTTWTSCGPYLNVPVSILTVPPADHLIPARNATTGHSIFHARFPHSLSHIYFHIAHLEAQLS